MSEFQRILEHVKAADADGNGVVTGVERLTQYGANLRGIIASYTTGPLAVQGDHRAGHPHPMPPEMAASVVPEIAAMLKKLGEDPAEREALIAQMGKDNLARILRLPPEGLKVVLATKGISDVQAPTHQEILDHLVAPFKELIASGGHPVGVPR